jgi:DNA-binding transcriptional LysR family regulator
LRCFLAAARVLHFRKAARVVALTPTAFGARIKQLEDQLGVPLFARTTRSVGLTEAGLALIPLAERCVGAAEDCTRIGRRGGEQAPMDLTLGTRHELGMSWVLPQRRRLMRARPWLHVHVYVSSGPDLLLRLRTLEIDCAITSTPLGDPKLDAYNLHREDYLLVAAPSLLKETPLRRAEDAARHTLLDISPDMPLFRYLRDASGGGDRWRFRRGSWLGTIAAIRHEVLAGAGVAVLPAYFVKPDIAAKKLRRLAPKEPIGHDFFRFVFRAADPRRAMLESLANDLASAPLC